jgi:hypothetical protein
LPNAEKLKVLTDLLNITYSHPNATSFIRLKFILNQINLLTIDLDQPDQEQALHGMAEVIMRNKWKNSIKQSLIGKICWEISRCWFLWSCCI